MAMAAAVVMEAAAETAAVPAAALVKAMVRVGAVGSGAERVMVKAVETVKVTEVTAREARAGEMEGVMVGG